MLIHGYPVRLQNGVRIVNRTAYGDYLIMYRNSEGNNVIIWLPEEVENNYPATPGAAEAIELVRKYIHSLPVQQQKIPLPVKS